MSTRLSGKKVLLGITGSIAAYKSAFLVRLLIKSGCEVKVIMTEGAKDFITPLTLQTLSTNPVISDLSSEEGWNNHVELGLWADAMLIAPITANTLAKVAHGLCDNMLTAAYLSARAPVMVAPAMDLDMWAHPATIRNVEQLTADGVKFIPVGDGELASGLHGPGRMAEPEVILAYLEDYFKKKSKLSLRAMVTAGPTYEDLDPVRFIGNRSSGKMGWAITKALADRGCQVDLVMGPTQINAEYPNVTVHYVRSAAEMASICLSIWPEVDTAILAAAVADFTPSQKATQKIKKGTNQDGLTISLVGTTDIAKQLGQSKRMNQISVGFALETQDAAANAARKLEQKNFDFIVVNTLEDEGAGFRHDTNKVSFIFPNHPVKTFPLKLKTEIAEDIVDQVEILAKQKLLTA